jgi:hypothetical protein
MMIIHKYGDIRSQTIVPGIEWMSRNVLFFLEDSLRKMKDGKICDKKKSVCSHLSQFNPTMIYSRHVHPMFHHMLHQYHTIYIHITFLLIFREMLQTHHIHVLRNVLILHEIHQFISILLQEVQYIQHYLRIMSDLPWTETHIQRMIHHINNHVIMMRTYLIYLLHLCQMIKESIHEENDVHDHVHDGFSEVQRIGTKTTLRAMNYSITLVIHMSYEIQQEIKEIEMVVETTMTTIHPCSLAG